MPRCRGLSRNDWTLPQRGGATRYSKRDPSRQAKTELFTGTANLRAHFRSSRMQSMRDTISSLSKYCPRRSKFNLHICESRICWITAEYVLYRTHRTQFRLRSHTHPNAFCGAPHNASLALSTYRIDRSKCHNETCRAHQAQWARPVHHY